MIDSTLLAAALPGYEIGEEIGRGGWGIVYRARQLSLGRTVAIKQLPGPSERSALDRFMEEARVVSRLDHPHVVGIYDFIEHDGHGFIIMEYVSGGSVWSQFSSTGFHSDDACVIGLAVASALHAAHRQRIIHRDVKPDNVLLTQAGDVRLTDFGNLAGIGFGRAHPTDLIGTPAYMSPEQVSGDPLTPASDVYGLGLMMHELLSGLLPFEPTIDRDVLYDQRFNQKPAPLPEFVAPAMRQVIAKALQRDPSDRFVSAEAFGAQMAGAANEWFGSDWLRHARGDLLDTSRIGNATRVSSMMPPQGGSHLMMAGVAQHERTGTLLQTTVAPGQAQPPQKPAAETEAPPPLHPPTAEPHQPEASAALPPRPATIPIGLDPTLTLQTDPTDVLPVTPLVGAAMTNNPGPPPGAPSMDPDVPPDEPAKSRKGLVIVLLLVTTLAVLGIVGAGLAFLLSSNGAPAEYCEAADRFNAQLALNDGNIDQLRFVVDQGGRVAPADIVDSWIELDQALSDLSAADAQARADTATSEIFNYSRDNCD